MLANVYVLNWCYAATQTSYQCEHLIAIMAITV